MQFKQTRGTRTRRMCDTGWQTSRHRSRISGTEQFSKFVSIYIMEGILLPVKIGANLLIPKRTARLTLVGQLGA